MGLFENVKEDWKEEWTYTGGREESMIDYLLVREEWKEEIERMKVGENV